jgi:uncharacterized protein YjbI with pentapeptide repeats
MKLLPSAFNGGLADWLDAISGLHEISLSQSLLGPVTYEGATFERVDFSGSTVRDSYFSRCIFRRCLFSESSFESTTLIQSEFENCIGSALAFNACTFANVTFDSCAIDQLKISSSKLDATSVTDCTIKYLDVSDASTLTIVIRATSLPLFRLSKCAAMSVRVSDVRDLTLDIDNASGGISFFNSEVIRFSSSDWSNAILTMKNSEISNALFSDNSEAIEIRSISSFLIDADLRKVDLVNSTFISSALVKCEWPIQEGRTDWFGKFQPPRNLLTQPAGDVSGLPEATRSHIERSQRMLLLESKNRSSRVALALHRLVGASTGHGRSPLRLVVFAAFLSASLAIANQSPHSFMRSVLFDWPRFFVIMVLIGNKTFNGLNSGLALTAAITGVALAGLLVTVLGNYLFLDS